MRKLFESRFLHRQKTLCYLIPNLQYFMEEQASCKIVNFMSNYMDVLSFSLFTSNILRVVEFSN